MNAIAHDTADRNAEIALARREGIASLTELADRFGISRERVRQIASNAGVDPVQAARAYVQRNGVGHSRIVLDEESVKIALDHWVQGYDHDQIAKILRAADIEANTAAVRAGVRRHATEIHRAMRRASRVAASNVHYDEQPREFHRAPRDDRRWTPQQTLAALVAYAKSNGGVLPGSHAYEVIAREDDSLPSLSTIRNRLGRYTNIRLMVYKEIEKQDG